MTSEFVHLHNHSDYSLLDGAQRIDQMINTIDDLNMDSVALTEHGNMFSVVPYYKYAKNAGMVSQSCLCITHSKLHTVDYYINLAKQLIELGTDEIAIKDMAGIGRPS